MLSGVLISNFVPVLYVGDKYIDTYSVTVHLPLSKMGLRGILKALIYKVTPNPSFPKRGTEQLSCRMYCHGC
jgi:hypothetical protein